MLFPLLELLSSFLLLVSVCDIRSGLLVLSLFSLTFLGDAFVLVEVLSLPLDESEGLTTTRGMGSMIWIVL